MSRIDTRRLAVEWVAIVLVVTGLLFLLRSQAVSPRRPEGPPAGPNAATGKATGSVAAQPDASASTGPPSRASKPSGDRPRPFPKIDLEMIGDLLYIAGYYVEGGIREFGKWSKALTRRFGKGSIAFGRSRKPFEKPPTEQSAKRFDRLSEEEKQRVLSEVKRALEDDQRLRQQFLQEPRLESRPPRASEPTKSPLVGPGSTEAQKTSSLDGRPSANVSRNLPNETLETSEETRKLLEFLRNADRQEFSATTAAILKSLKMKPLNKEDAYCWIVENRHRFAGLVFGGDQPSNRFEDALVACARRQIAEIVKHFHAIAGQGQQVAFAQSQPSPQWALEWLASHDLEEHLSEVRDLIVVDRLSDDLYPVAFLAAKPLGLPPWFPEEFQGQPLSPSERLTWFDELLRDYCDSPLTWPLTDDENLKSRRLLRSLYLMYHDWTMDMLPAPSFIPAKPSKRARSPESLTPN